MKSNETASLLQAIQAKTGDSLDTIAEKTGYTRPYISRVKGEGGSEALNNRLREVYIDILPKVTDTDKITALSAAVQVLLAEVAAIKARETGEPVQSVILRLQKAAEDIARQG